MLLSARGLVHVAAGGSSRGRGRFARRFIPIANQHAPAADLLQPPAAGEDDTPH